MDEDKNPCGRIYVITNAINGKMYVGQTTRSIRDRLREHRHSTNTVIGRAIHKYHWENFFTIVIEECYSLEQLNEREMYYISVLNTTVPNGYNMTTGGKNGKGMPKSAETRAKMKAPQEVNRKPVCCIETGEIFESILAATTYYGIGSGEIGEACKCKRNTAGKLHRMFLEDWLSSDEDTRAKRMSKSAHCRKRVRCIETDEVFASTREAGRKYSTDHKNIARACKKPNRTAIGKHWEYID